MSEAVSFLAPMDAAPSRSSVPMFFALVLRKVRRLLLTQHEQNLLKFVEFLAGEIGGPLLLAEDLADLETRLERGLEDPRLSLLEVVSRTSDFPSVEELGEQSDESLDQTLVEAFGSSAEPRLRRGAQLALALLRVQPQLTALVYAQPNTTSADPLAFLGLVPSEVGRSLVGSLRSSVCLLALTQVLLSETKPPGWLLRALIENWVDGLEQFMRFIAGIPGVPIPAEVVPLKDRLDLESLDRLLSARNERFAAMMRAGPDVEPLDGDA